MKKKTTWKSWYLIYEIKFETYENYSIFGHLKRKEKKIIIFPLVHSFLYTHIIKIPVFRGGCTGSFQGPRGWRNYCLPNRKLASTFWFLTCRRTETPNRHIYFPPNVCAIFQITRISWTCYSNTLSYSSKLIPIYGRHRDHIFSLAHDKTKRLIIFVHLAQSLSNYSRNSWDKKRKLAINQEQTFLIIQNICLLSGWIKVRTICSVAASIRSTKPSRKQLYNMTNAVITNQVIKLPGWKSSSFNSFYNFSANLSNLRGTKSARPPLPLSFLLFSLDENFNDFATKGIWR